MNPRESPARFSSLPEPGEGRQRARSVLRDARVLLQNSVPCFLQYWLPVQLPHLYLEDAMYSSPLKLTCPESHVQILMLQFKK